MYTGLVRIVLFQSTSPVWGMTSIVDYCSRECAVSIHIPRVGDDAAYRNWLGVRDGFQSTSPVWGMTCNVMSRQK